MTLGEHDFYCLRCKEYVIAKKGSICKDTYKNGRLAMRGMCPKGHKLSKMVSNKSSKNIKKKYNDCPDTTTNTDSNTVVEVGGVIALLALLAGGIAVTVKTLKNC